MLVKFGLTREHIQAGKPSSWTECPVAICIDEHLKDGFLAAVTFKYVSIYDIREVEIKAQGTTELPDSIQKFVLGFDLGTLDFKLYLNKNPNETIQVFELQFDKDLEQCLK